MIKDITNMPKFNVVFSWSKYIAFPEIDANTKNGAIGKAKEMLTDDPNLTEETGLENWEAEQLN
jgi:hypothetical protein